MEFVMAIFLNLWTIIGGVVLIAESWICITICVDTRLEIKINRAPFYSFYFLDFQFHTKNLAKRKRKANIQLLAT